MSETIVREHAPVWVEPEPQAAASADGDPGLIGVPTFLVGSIALGLVLTGFAPAAAVGASIPIIMTATGIGQAPLLGIGELHHAA